MRHRVDHRKLNRTASHRKAMLCNMVTSLFASERITTTDAKAKEARRLAERLITRARKGYTAHQEGLSLREAGKEDEAKQMEAVALAHWRQAGRYVRKISILKKLFEEIAPQYLEREGGYTRIIKMSRRLGDNAKTVLLELVGAELTGKASKKDDDAVEADAKESKAKPKAKAKSKAKSKAKAKTKDSGKDDKPEKAKSKTKSKSKSKTKSKSKSSSKKKAEE
jgi:large subunit ribosomal protein L17